MIYFGAHHLDFRESIKMENLERKIGTLQSSYTRAINHQEGRVGSLFQAKFKVVEIIGIEQAVTCFNYIHRNPVKAGLVNEAGMWTHSSFNEYDLTREGICKRDIAYERLKVPREVGKISEWMETANGMIGGGDEGF